MLALVRANEGVVVCVRVIKQKMELRYQWEYGTEKNKNKFIERKAFVDTVGINSDDLKKDKFCFRVLRLC